MRDDANATWSEEASVASSAFGVLSLVMSWLFPLGPVLGAAGLVAGVLGWFRGDRSGRAAVGVALAGTGIAVGLLAAWGSWVRLFSI
jgi:hypothetical protein